jgi:hypothetical protein
MTCVIFIIFNEVLVISTALTLSLKQPPEELGAHPTLCTSHSSFSTPKHALIWPCQEMFPQGLQKEACVRYICSITHIVCYIFYMCSTDPKEKEGDFYFNALPNGKGRLKQKQLTAPTHRQPLGMRWFQFLEG